VMTRAEMRAGLDLLPTWVLEQRRPPIADSSRLCAYDWLLASRRLACTRSRSWPPPGPASITAAGPRS
jgi:hypothetical protein